MKNEYGDKIALNSSMLGGLLSKLDEQNLGSVQNILQVKNVQKFLNDEELTITVEKFLENNLNIIQASKSAIIHRNTLIYRLEKIKRLLGLDIRKFEDAVTLQIILTLNKLQIKQAKMSTKPTISGLK